VVGPGNQRQRMIELLVADAQRARAQRDVRAAGERVAQAASMLVQDGQLEVALRLCLELDQPARAAEIAQAAGDHHRAAELWLAAGDTLAAAAARRNAGAPELAAELYADAGQFGLAAKVMEEAGAYFRAAELLEQAGDRRGAALLLTRTLAHETPPLSPVARETVRRAGSLFIESSAVDEAVRLLRWAGELDFAARRLAESGWAEAALQLHLERDDVAAAEAVARAGGLFERGARRIAEHHERAGRLLEAAHAYLAAAQPRRAAALFDAVGASLLAAQAIERAGDWTHAAERYLDLGEAADAARCREHAAGASAAHAVANSIAASTSARSAIDGALALLASTRTSAAGRWAGASAGAASAADRVLYTQAARLLDGVDPADPDWPTAATILGVLLAELGENARALATLHRLFSVAPPRPTQAAALHAYARLLEGEGAIGEARRAYRQLLVFEPGNAEATERLARLDARITGGSSSMLEPEGSAPPQRTGLAPGATSEGADPRRWSVPTLPLVVGQSLYPGTLPTSRLEAAPAAPSRSLPELRWTPSVEGSAAGSLARAARASERGAPGDGSVAGRGALAGAETLRPGRMDLQRGPYSRGAGYEPAPSISSAMRVAGLESGSTASLVPSALRPSPLAGVGTMAVEARGFSAMTVPSTVPPRPSEVVPPEPASDGAPEPGATSHGELVGLVLRERFRLERKLGQGAQAEVFLARDEVLDRPVAIKVLAEKAAGDEKALERFLREARLAARVSHSSCLAIFDFGQERGLTFMAMEYFRGRTLRDLLRRGPLSVEVALKIGREVASALAAVHEAGIVHRDVKPTNVMIDQQGNVRLTDFGVAQGPTDEVGGAGLMVGTMKYMAPEQARGKRTDRRADVFALGAVLFEMLSGQSAFGATLEALVARVGQDPPELPAGVQVSERVRNLLRSAMARRRSERLPSMEALVGEIDLELAALRLANAQSQLVQTVRAAAEEDADDDR
jgi:tRNA A-37 threonylcarbamoyl transferase component Bud32